MRLNLADFQLYPFSRPLGYDEAATAVLRAGGRIILLAPQEARTILAERINAVLRLEENAS